MRARMGSSSLLLKLIVPYVTALLLIALALVYAVPERQRSIFFDNVMDELVSISETAVNSIEIAIEAEDFNSISIVNRLLESHPNVSFAAIYSEEDGVSELFAIYPDSLANDPAFAPDSGRYLTHQHPIETALFSGHVVVGYDVSLFEMQARQLNMPIYLAFAFVLLVQLLSYRMISRSVVRPIRRAAIAADALGKGGLESSLQLASRDDEIGQLHDSLQNLQHSLLEQRTRNDELLASLEERVEERTAELKEALLTKDNFLSAVSHELRTPLHGIISSFELQQKYVEDVELPSECAEIAQNGLLSARSLLTLINDLLDYQKFASQGVEIRPQPTLMSDLLKRLEKIINPLFDADAVRVHMACTTCEGLWVSVDAQRLEQILVNLLGNARKFTHEGEVVLTMNSEVIDGRTRCTFAISDTGIGMDEDTIRRLGEPFFQQTEGYNRSFGGTGLGLSIVKSLLEAMGSRLDVQSTLGEGSTFSFVLDVPTEEPPASREEDAVGVQPLEQQLHMLYVEDVKVNQFFMVAMAKRLNVELTLASSALEGYELIKSRSFDLVLTDIQMPEHDGTELLEWVRSNPDVPPRLPVIAFTAHAEHDRVEQFLAMGFDRVLTKPLHFDQLRSALDAVKSEREA